MGSEGKATTQDEQCASKHQSIYYRCYRPGSLIKLKYCIRKLYLPENSVYYDTGIPAFLSIVIVIIRESGALKIKDTRNIESEGWVYHRIAFYQ